MQRKKKKIAQTGKPGAKKNLFTSQRCWDPALSVEFVARNLPANRSRWNPVTADAAQGTKQLNKAFAWTPVQDF